MSQICMHWKVTQYVIAMFQVLILEEKIENKDAEIQRLKQALQHKQQQGTIDVATETEVFDKDADEDDIKPMDSEIESV